jgi:hypothetical protein
MPFVILWSIITIIPMVESLWYWLLLKQIKLDSVFIQEIGLCINRSLGCVDPTIVDLIVIENLKSLHKHFSGCITFLLLGNQKSLNRIYT